MTVGLLRDLAALRWVELAPRIDLTEAAVRRCYQTQRGWMASERDYRHLAGLLAKRSLPR